MNSQIHPRRQSNGTSILINNPSIATPLGAFNDPDLVVTVVPDSVVPESLNGIAFAQWHDAPSSPEDWAKVVGQIELNEPPVKSILRKKIASGAIVTDPDGRVWLVAPTNAFSGYIATFPKGTQDHGSSLQATAIKEVFEESGLRVRITGLYGDIERSASVTRYYFAERTGGSPADMGWESQAVHLVPKNHLYNLLNQKVDHPIAKALGAIYE